MDEWGLVPEDDMFHPPESADPWWTETVWFSWNVPERNLLGYWYAVIRANLGVTFGGVLVVDDTAVLPWEIPVFDWHWHEPMPESVDLCNLDVMGGMTLQCVEYGRGFRFGYANDDVEFDLEFRALMQPMLTRHEPPFNHGTHVDQPGRVHGRMRLHGDDVAVDCIAMRDRSWGIRAPRRQPKLGYCHAMAAPHSSFLSITVERRGEDGLVRGYLMRDGEWANLVEGRRTVERDQQGRPARVRVDAVDELGRVLEAHGTTVSRQVFTAYPDMFCWNSLARWEYDDVVAWGEDQDIWHPRRWRDFARNRRDDPVSDPDLVDWVRAATGAVELDVERRTGGASREGYAVDVQMADGDVRALWLRVDSGAGPQSDTLYSLRREAAVYRALGATELRVARLVAVHPDRDAFLLERIDGDGRFAAITDAAEQVAVATSFMEQMAVLHSVDPRTLDLPELGAPTRVSDHVHAELDEWEAQYRTHDEPDPLLVLALAWLRDRMPDDASWPVVLVQGDTGPGNFMYRGHEVAAITDWELAHWGDLHDDLGWICVRDTQERFTDLAARFRDYERFGGRRIDPDRLRYFRVLAQTRCAIGTRRGLLARDHRAEMAAHLIFNTLHLRLLAGALTEAEGLDLPPMAPLEAGESDASWAFDVALDDLRAHIVPQLGESFAARRAKGLARLLKYLLELQRLGPAAERAECRELSVLLGHEVTRARDGRAELCAAIDSGAVDLRRVIPFCRGAVADWTTQIVGPAMGALAGRHYAPIE